MTGLGLLTCCSLFWNLLTMPMVCHVSSLKVQNKAGPWDPYRALLYPIDNANRASARTQLPF